MATPDQTPYAAARYNRFTRMRKGTPQPIKVKVVRVANPDPARLKRALDRLLQAAKRK